MAGEQQETPDVAVPSVISAVQSDIVTIEIGPNRKQYHVHKALITHHSDYFRNTFRGPWIEAHEKSVPLLDIEPTTFNIFLQWLYTNKIPAYEADDKEWDIYLEGEDCNDTSLGEKLFMILLKAYVFADRFLAHGFRCAVSKRLSDHVRFIDLEEPLCWKVFSYAFSNIPLERPILQHLVDDFCYEYIDFPGEEGHDMTAEVNQPREFLMRVMRALPSTRVNELEILSGRCYYEHASEKEEEACRKKYMVFDEVKDGGYFNDD